MNLKRETFTTLLEDRGSVGWSGRVETVNVETGVPESTVVRLVRAETVRLGDTVVDVGWEGKAWKVRVREVSFMGEHVEFNGDWTMKRGAVVALVV